MIQKAISLLLIVRLKRPISSLARSRKAAMAAVTATGSGTPSRTAPAPSTKQPKTSPIVPSFGW
jgi:hypothetical protein